MVMRMIERGNRVREGGIVYGYVNGNVNEGDWDDTDTDPDAGGTKRERLTNAVVCREALLSIHTVSSRARS